MHNRQTGIAGLTERYTSLIEIVHDPFSKGIAYAMDMNYVDWLNFQIKNFIIRKRFMNQVVQVNIDGELVSLTHPYTHLPLLYQDFITDRSGPKFAGYLNELPGTEYLEGNVSEEEAKEFMQLLAFNTKHYCENNELPVLDDKTLSDTLSTFQKKHQSQRKLSDFDLTARETQTLELAIVAEVEKKLSPEEAQHLRTNPKLANAIGKTAWQIGGIIHTSIIRDYLEAKEPLPLTYRQTVCDTMTFPSDHYDKARNEEVDHPYTHMLIHGVGETIRKEYLSLYKHLKIKNPPLFYKMSSSGVPDTLYGVGIPFFEASIDEADAAGNITLSTKKEVIEIGDVICDNSAIFGRVFNAKNNFNIACQELKKLGVSDDNITMAIETIKKSDMEPSEVYEKTLEYLISKNEIPIVEKEKILLNYRVRHSFIESSLIAEEAGKKEAQSQLYKQENNTGKLIGNISDTGCFALGMLKASNNNPNAMAHLDILKLTTLISVIRWGIDQTNHKKVANTHAQLTPEEFMKSLNYRSYQGQPSSGMREALKLNQISKMESSKRLEEYRLGFQPVWDTIQKNDEFFELIHQYKQAKEALKKATKENQGAALHYFGETYNHLRTYMDKLINTQMPALAEKLNSFSVNAAEKEATMVSIMDQLEEAIAFGMERELKLNQRKSANASISPSEHPTLLTQRFFHVSRLRQNKITGPKMYKEIKKIQTNYGDQIALQAAKEFLQWKKAHHKNYNVKEIKQFVKTIK